MGEIFLFNQQTGQRTEVKDVECNPQDSNKQVIHLPAHYSLTIPFQQPLNEVEFYLRRKGVHYFRNTSRGLTFSIELESVEQEFSDKLKSLKYGDIVVITSLSVAS